MNIENDRYLWTDSIARKELNYAAILINKYRNSC